MSWLKWQIRQLQFRPDDGPGGGDSPDPNNPNPNPGGGNPPDPNNSNPNPGEDSAEIWKTRFQEAKSGRDQAKQKLSLMEAEISKLREVTEAIEREKREKEEKALADKGQFQELLKRAQEDYHREKSMMFSELSRTRINSEIIGAASNSAIDPMEISDLLSPGFELDTKTLSVKIKAQFFQDRGIEVFDSIGNELKIRDIVSAYLAKKPHLQKPTGQTGGGTRPGETKIGISYADFKKLSPENQEIYLDKNPGEVDRLRSEMLGS